jgi:hypothetical protein
VLISILTSPPQQLQAFPATYFPQGGCKDIQTL